MILQLRNVYRTLSGLAIGSLFIVLIFNEYSLQELIKTTQNIQTPLIVCAVGSHLSAMMIRVFRWRLLLKEENRHTTLSSIGKTLLIGYAANNLLPARLGELVRADIGKQRLKLSRSTILGSIAVERLLDGITIVIFLIAGLTLLGLYPPSSQASINPLFWKIGIASGVIFLAAFLLFWLSTKLTDRLDPYKMLQRQIYDFAAALTVVRSIAILSSFMISVFIWLLEALALNLILQSLGVHIGLPATLMLIGVMTLSTLIPTAPGYLGTLQYSLQLGIKSIGEPGAIGVVAATLIQIFLYGTIILIATVLILIDSFLNAIYFPLKNLNRKRNPEQDVQGLKNRDI